MELAWYLAALVSAGIMTGVIWFVQIVHYPLFALVRPESFPSYEARNTNITAWVVLPPMLVELLATGVLLSSNPEWLPTWSAWAGAACVAVAWISTVTLQAPMHGRLKSGFDAKVHKRLVRTNWIRVVAWSAHFGLLVWPLSGLLRAL